MENSTQLIPEAQADDEHWDFSIEPHSHLFALHFDDLWRYRDLIWMFVKRDVVSVYKQTVLGPIWFFVQPLLTTTVFTVVFSGIAKIPTDGMPPILFYLAGTIPWNYFATCLNKTSTTFVTNAHIFGKVYFPRLVVPVSVVISNLIQFAIQFFLFAFVFVWYYCNGTIVEPNWPAIIGLTPVLVLLMAMLGLSTGIVASALTTKYRDFTFLLGFGVQLGLYATPIIYPLSAVPEKFSWLVFLNPMSGPVEAFRASFLGGPIPWGLLGLSCLITICTFFAGAVLFNRVEKTFVDTV